jgi:uncharacterized protein DUF4158
VITAPAAAIHFVARQAAFLEDSAVASIERIAYPRLKRHSSAAELHSVYTPSPAEIEFAASAGRGDQHLLTLTVLLKVFQRLGYFRHGSLRIRLREKDAFFKRAEHWPRYSFSRRFGRSAV